MSNDVKISGVYNSNEIAGNGHVEGRLTMSVEEIRDRVREQAQSGVITMVDLKAIEQYLDKKEYRAEYNRRPEVKEKRKVYMMERREREKAGAQLLKQLMGGK